MEFRDVTQTEPHRSQSRQKEMSFQGLGFDVRSGKSEEVSLPLTTEQRFKERIGVT